MAAVGVSAAEIAGPRFPEFSAGCRDSRRRDCCKFWRTPNNGDATTPGNGQPVVVEFVSANPTGPLHVGHGRQAALGDAISTLLEYTGWNVSREFYYNDSGVQIANLALSLQARVRELNGAALAKFLKAAITANTSAKSRSGTLSENPSDKSGDDLEAMRVFAVAALRHEQDLDLQAFGVKFNTYYLESSLYSDGLVAKTVEALKGSGHTYEEEGALFLRTTEFGDDKDRVMKKSAAKGGDYTYFVPDVAYHVTKWESRIQARHQRAGRGSSQHGDTRARWTAGDGTWKFRKDIPTTCCTRWSRS